MTREPRRPAQRASSAIAWSFGRQVLVAIMQLGLILIVARLLGPAGAGTYSVALLLPTLLAQLATLGLSNSSVYFIASGKVGLQSAWAASRDAFAVAGVAGLAFGLGLVLLFGEAAFPGIPLAVVLAALLTLPCQLYAVATSSFLQALQNFQAFNKLALVQPGIACLSLLILMTLGEVDLLSVMAVAVLSHFIACLYGMRLLSRHVPLFQRVSSVERWRYLRPALVYGLKAHLSNIVTFLNYRLDVFLVNFFTGPAASGLYVIAVRLAEQLWLLSYAAGSVVYPQVASMQGEEARRHFAPAVARIVLWVTVIAAGLLAAVGEPLLLLIFGGEFLGAVHVLLLLLPGVTLLAASRVLANDLAGQGRVGFNLVLALLILAINTGGNFILIPRYGIAGAGAATTIAYTFDWIIRVALLRRLTGVAWRVSVVPALEDFRRIVALGRSLKKL